MVTLIANKSTLSILEVSGLQFSITDADMVDKLKDAIVANYGVAKSDVSMLQFADNHATVTRLHRGDDYTIVWANGEISGLNFSNEDAKNKFTIEATPAQVAVGGQVTVTVRLFRPNGTALTSVNAAFRLPVVTPTGRATVAMQFVSGVATKTFTLSIPGEYKIGTIRQSGFVLSGTMPAVEVDL